MSEYNATENKEQSPIPERQHPSAIKLYRCHHPRCLAATKQNGHVFVSASKEPKCPACGTDNSHPRLGHLVARLALIHFDPPHDSALMIGKNVWACAPDRAIQGASPGADGYTPHMGTGDPRAVNCPACKETAEYASAIARCEE